mmetsp:Transcript_85044/g.164886  ORF Transcript_85044/g.164886 Transcript_85044/m.164886 type:complete len:651 (+) Transcript_85044:216-2168(+)
MGMQVCARSRSSEAPCYKERGCLLPKSGEEEEEEEGGSSAGRFMAPVTVAPLEAATALSAADTAATAEVAPTADEEHAPPLGEVGSCLGQAGVKPGRSTTIMVMLSQPVPSPSKSGARQWSSTSSHTLTGATPLSSRAATKSTTSWDSIEFQIPSHASTKKRSVTTRVVPPPPPPLSPAEAATPLGDDDDAVDEEVRGAPAPAPALLPATPPASSSRQLSCFLAATLRRTVLMSGKAVIIWRSTGTPRFFLYSRSPIARLRFKFPSMRPSTTLPPAASTRDSSGPSSGLWSYDMSSATPSPRHRTHRESPALATVKKAPPPPAPAPLSSKPNTATTAVAPLSTPTPPTRGCGRRSRNKAFDSPPTPLTTTAPPPLLLSDTALSASPATPPLLLPFSFPSGLEQASSESASSVVLEDASISSPERSATVAVAASDNAKESTAGEPLLPLLLSPAPPSPSLPISAPTAAPSLDLAAFVVPWWWASSSQQSSHSLWLSSSEQPSSSPARRRLFLIRSLTCVLITARSWLSVKPHASAASVISSKSTFPRLLCRFRSSARAYLRSSLTPALALKATSSSRKHRCRAPPKRAVSTGAAVVVVVAAPVLHFLNASVFRRTSAKCALQNNATSGPPWPSKTANSERFVSGSKEALET